MLEGYCTTLGACALASTELGLTLHCLLLPCLAVLLCVKQKLGLGLLGAKPRAEWSPQEETLFALGML
jgi:hypothetical protein